MNGRSTDVVRRRTVLAGALAAGAAVMTGCTTGAPRQTPAPPPDPLEALLDSHVQLRAAYDSAIQAIPTDTRLPGLRANVDQHINALAGALAKAPPSAAGSSAGSPAPSSSTPVDPATTVAALSASEQDLSAQCRALALSEPAKRAPLLASLVAAHALAPVVLS